MKRPSRFYVEWFECDPDAFDEPLESTTRDVASLAEGKRIWQEVGGRVVERINITDTTPAEDGRGLCWDWEEREVWS